MGLDAQSGMAPPSLDKSARCQKCLDEKGATAAAVPTAAVDCRNSRRVSGAGLMPVMVVQPCAAGHCIEFQPVQESRIPDCPGGLQTIDSHRTCGGARSATAAGLRIRNPRARSLWWRLIVARIEVRERQHNIRAKEKPADLAGFCGCWLVDQLLKDWNQILTVIPAFGCATKSKAQLASAAN